MRALFFIILIAAAHMAMGQGAGYYVKGQNYEYLRDFKRAEKFYKKGMKSGSIESQLALARLYYKTNQYKESLKIYTSLQSNEAIFANKDYVRFWHTALTKGNTQLADSLMTLMTQRDILKMPNAISTPEMKDFKPFTSKVDGAQFFTADYDGFIMMNNFIETGEGLPDYAKEVGMLCMKTDGTVIRLKDIDLPFTPNTNNQGPIFYHPQTKQLFVTESSVVNGLKKLRFVYYTKADGVWQGPFVPGFVNSNYNFAYPVVTPEGNLVFSSDKPGGKGGMDLYEVPVSKLEKGKPTPLAQINSKGDEVFPSIVENKLYFSSNGYKGMGGLDIYRYDDQGVTAFNEDLNSLYDDLMPCKIGEYVYFTTNRKSKGVTDEVYRCKMINWGNSQEIIEEVVPAADTTASTVVIEPEKKEEPKPKVDDGSTVGAATYTVKLVPQFNNPMIDLNALKVTAVRKGAKPGEKDVTLKVELVKGGQGDSLFSIVAGSFGNADNAKRQADKIKAKGFSATLVPHNGLTRVIVSSTKNKAAAESTLGKLKTAGIDAFVFGSVAPSTMTLKVSVPQNLAGANSKFEIRVDQPGLSKDPLVIPIDKLKSGNAEMPLKESK